MVALNQNRIRPSPSSRSAPFLRQTPPQNNTTSSPPIRLLLRARYYDPTTGEFTSPDPLEYVDGMNLFRGYFGLGHIDSYGLLKMTVRDVKRLGKCGGFMHVIKWEMDPNEKDGFIVQKVCFNRRVDPCEKGGEVECTKPKDWKEPPNKRTCLDNCYIEVWRVEKGIPKINTGYPRADIDTFGHWNCPNSQGSYSADGAALFVPLDDAKADPTLDVRPLVDSGLTGRGGGVQWAHSLFSACMSDPGVTEFWEKTTKKYGVSTSRHSETIWSCCKVKCEYYDSRFDGEAE